jgi:hypothetical protein
MNACPTSAERGPIKNGLIGFFDILGYKEIIKQNQVVRVASIIEEIFLEALRESQDAHKCVTSLINQEACQHFVFSDSILVFLPLERSPNSDTQTAESLFASHCAGLITKCFWEGLPVRGALAYGKCYFKKADGVVCFAGQAIIDAHLCAESLEFSGCVVAESKDRIFSRRHSDFFKHIVHFNKKSRKKPESMFVLNNYAGNWGPRKLSRQIVKNKFSAHKKGIPGNVLPKITNTLAFLKACKERSVH